MLLCKRFIMLKNQRPLRTGHYVCNFNFFFQNRDSLYVIKAEIFKSIVLLLQSKPSITVTHPLKFLKRLLKEIKEAGLISLYFLFCFSIVLFLKKLFLASYGIDFYVMSKAIVGALILGKVVLILDKTPLGNRFQNKPIYIDVIYRSLVYASIVFLILLAEQTFHLYQESGSFKSAIMERYESRDLNYFIATNLCVYLSFIVYNVFSAIDRHLGKGKLKKLFLSSKSNPGNTSD